MFKSAVKYCLLGVLLLALFSYLYFLFLGFTLGQKINQKGTKLVALTFDDGPSEGTKEILQVLKSESIKATFFVIGKESTKNPELLKQIFSEGHTLGLHSWDHPHFLALGVPEL